MCPLPSPLRYFKVCSTNGHAAAASKLLAPYPAEAAWFGYSVASLGPLPRNDGTLSSGGGGVRLAVGSPGSGRVSVMVAGRSPSPVPTLLPTPEPSTARPTPLPSPGPTLHPIASSGVTNGGFETGYSGFAYSYQDVRRALINKTFILINKLPVRVLTVGAFLSIPSVRCRYPTGQ